MQLEEYFADNEGFIYYVTSERDETLKYLVACDYDDGWWCGCDDHYYRKHECKHIRAVKEHLQEKCPKIYLKSKNMKTFAEIQTEKSTRVC